MSSNLIFYLSYRTWYCRPNFWACWEFTDWRITTNNSYIYVKLASKFNLEYHLLANCDEYIK